MVQSSSSSKPHVQKSAVACPEDTRTKMKNKNQHQQSQKQKQRVRSPFQDLNNAATDTNSNASVSSIEASQGCLRFFISHTSSSNKTHCSSCSGNGNHRPSRTKLLSTPKSAPNLRPAKENSSKRFVFRKPFSHKLDKCKTNPPEHGRKKGSRNAKISNVLNSGGSSENKLRSVPREVEQVVVGGVSDFDGSTLTPVNKVTSLNIVVANGVVNEHDEKSKGSCNSNTKSTSGNTKTPPVEASVSPEIQCGSSMVSTTAKTITPVCYGAGHVMSGVVDKRKCRPRGILTIGEAKPLSCFESDDEIEEDNGLGLVNDSSISALPLPSEASMHWLLSPCNEEDEEEKNLSDLAEEASRFSPASLSSGNVIQTPQSDCSSDRPIGISWRDSNSDRKNLNFGCKLNSIVEHIQMASSSPKSYVSIWDPAGSSFQFDCLSSPSNSVDLSQFQKVLDDRMSWLSDSTMGNASQSQMRISWREGLVSRMFEMDEFDSCRCLSDAEDDANVLESHCSPVPNVDAVNEPDLGCTIDVKGGHGSDRKADEKFTHQVPFTCAESISTDAGSLVRSEDSDWTICYKNKLFHEQ